MDSSWIPPWVGVLWACVLAGVVVVHGRHALMLRGRLRVWHGTHIAMGLGMIVMFAPTDPMIVSAGGAEVVFVVLAVLTLVGAVFDRLATAVHAWLWGIAMFDLASMVYMFQMMTDRSQVLSLVLAGWFAVEAFGWASGSLVQQLPDFAAAAPIDRAARAATSSTQSDGQHEAHARDLRITLTVMSIAMAYMFLAMQYGVGTMAEM